MSLLRLVRDLPRTPQIKIGPTTWGCPARALLISDSRGREARNIVPEHQSSDSWLFLLGRPHPEGTWAGRSEHNGTRNPDLFQAYSVVRESRMQEGRNVVPA
jgi:hypothetical protein